MIRSKVFWQQSARPRYWKVCNVERQRDVDYLASVDTEHVIVLHTSHLEDELNAQVWAWRDAGVMVECYERDQPEEEDDDQECPF